MELDGTSVLNRIYFSQERSRLLASLCDDARLAWIASLEDEELVVSKDYWDGLALMFHNPNIGGWKTGLPWHKDCSLGGHSIMCPQLSLGIHLHSTTPENGALKFLSGSHRCSYAQRVDVDDTGISVAAEAGDVTVHYRDLVHAAPPANGSTPGRTSFYINFGPARVFALVPPGKTYSEIFFDQDWATIF